MRWPDQWRNPSAIDLLKGTVISHLLVNKGADLGPIADRASQAGLEVCEPGSPPSSVTLVDGEWPGVKLTQSGALDHASAGPTGSPWVDSNAWKIRLTTALHPGAEVWINAEPKRSRLTPAAYRITIADAAACGGRWIISLDSQHAAGILAGNPSALEARKKVTGAAAFFANRKAWLDYIPQAIVGIISDFSGPNEFMSHELLNLLARTNEQYRIIPKGGVHEASFKGLRAVLYTDEDPPTPELRSLILAFIQSGGFLITGPKWGQLPDALRAAESHPRYTLLNYGKGRFITATPDFEDPYVVANDTVVLISHRYDLLRLWNGGALGSYFTKSHNGNKALVQLLFYAFILGDRRPSVRVVGRYRTAQMWTLNQELPHSVEIVAQEDAVEVHLPPVASYAAVELEV